MKLTATNSAGSDDEIKTGYVTVGAPLTFVTFTPGRRCLHELDEPDQELRV